MNDGNIGTISIDLDLDQSAFDRALTASETRAQTAGRAIARDLAGATERTEERFASLGAVGVKALAATGIAAGIAGLASVKMAGDFEQSLNVFQSVSAATAKQMEQVAAKARELGQDASLPGISARDAAVALTELAKAGLSVQQSLAASKGVLSLAKAGNLDVAAAASIAARALNAFGLEGGQAAKVADLLAAAANASSAGVEDIALGLAQVGSGAKQMGVNLTDSIAALALFTNAGIQGQDAGTSLKQMFIQLASPTKQAADLMKKLGLDFFDAKGNFVGLEKTSEQLQTKLKGLTAEQRNNALATIFGSDSMRVAAILADQGATGFNNMAKAVSKQGAATQLAAAQNKGFNGALDNFISTLQTIGIDLGTKVLPPITEFLKVMAQQLPPAMDFVTKHGHELAGAILAIGAAFATIRLAGLLADLATAQKSLALFIGTKNANGIFAIRDGIVAIGGATKTAAGKVASIAKTAAIAAADTSRAGATAAAGWIAAAGRALKAWVVAFASMIGNGVRTAARLTVQGSLAAGGWIVSAVRAAAAWVAAFATIVARSFWAGLQTQSPATAAALAWIANGIKIAAVWTAQFVIIVGRATIAAVVISGQATIAALGWITKGVLLSVSWIASFTAIVARSVVTAAVLTGQAVIAAAGWLLQPLLIAATWLGQFALIVGRAGLAALAISGHAALASAGWILHAALAAGAWIVRFLALTPFMLGSAIGMAAQAVIVSTAWIASAAASTAAWIAANVAMFGVFAVIAVAVVAIVALIIRHWQQVKDFLSGVWDGLKVGIVSALTIGQEIIAGIVRGLQSAAGSVVDKIKEICGKALDAVKKFFGIHSPSSVMATMGENLMQGLAQGITKAGSDATSAMAGVSSNLASALSIPQGSFALDGSAAAAMGPGSGSNFTQQNTFKVYNQADASLIANELAWRAKRA